MLNLFLALLSGGIASVVLSIEIRQISTFKTIELPQIRDAFAKVKTAKCLGVGLTTFLATS